MSNTFKKIFLFIFYFSLFLLVTLPPYYFFKDTEFKKLSNSFSVEQVRTTCPISPEKESYLDCFRPSIIKLIEAASPMEVLKIPSLIKDLRDRDIYQGVFPSQTLQSQYLGSIVVMIRNLSLYEIKRKNIDFFQILILPFIRTYFQRTLAQIKEETNQYVKDNPDFLSIEMNKMNFNLINSTRIEIF